jgi:uncharacterized DUF497 family protein
MNFDEIIALRKAFASVREIVLREVGRERLVVKSKSNATHNKAALPISARDMTMSERKYYEKQKKKS